VRLGLRYNSNVWFIFTGNAICAHILRRGHAKAVGDAWCLGLDSCHIYSSLRLHFLWEQISTPSIGPRSIAPVVSAFHFDDERFFFFRRIFADRSAHIETRHFFSNRKFFLVIGFVMTYMVTMSQR
jgi:hypothetical protein